MNKKRHINHHVIIEKKTKSVNNNNNNFRTLNKQINVTKYINLMTWLSTECGDKWKEKEIKENIPFCVCACCFALD